MNTFNLKSTLVVSVTSLMMISSIAPILAQDTANIDSLNVTNICKDEIIESSGIIHDYIDGIEITYEEPVVEQVQYENVSYTYYETEPVYEYVTEEPIITVDEFLSEYETDASSIDISMYEQAYQQAVINYNTALAEYEAANQMIETTKEVEVEITEEITDEDGNVSEITRTEIQPVTELIPAGDIDTAQSNLNTASIELDNAYQALEIASNTLNEDTVNSSQIEQIEGYDEVVNSYTYATNKALEIANKNLTKAQKATDAAKKAADDAEVQIAKGSKGFFEYLGDEDALKALEIDVPKDERGWRYSEDTTDEEFESIVEKTRNDINLGEKNDATSLENMEKALEMIGHGNDIRFKEEGLEPLRVSSYLMATAQVYADGVHGELVRAKSYDGLNHLGYFNVAENLSPYGYNIEDPYIGWFYEEKENVEKGSGQTGHYENLINTSYQATGYGIRTDETKYSYKDGYNFHPAGLEVNSQTFKSHRVLHYNNDTNSYEFINEPLEYASYDYDEYVKMFNDYYQPLKEAAQKYEDAKKALADAQAAVNNVKKNGIPFSDVAKSAWYYATAKECFETGLISGTSLTKFSPNQAMTRAMVVTILWRMAGSPNTAFSKKFKDVSSKQWYSTAISWASKNGVVYGYSDGTFKPDAAVTKEQIAVMLSNYAKYKKVYKAGTKKLNVYPDGSQVSTYAQPGMKWALTNGIIQGDGKGYLHPKKNATRAEGAAMLLRMKNWL